MGWGAFAPDATRSPDDKTVFLQNKLDDPEAILKLFPFMENDLGGLKICRGWTEGAFYSHNHMGYGVNLGLWGSQWGRMSRRILTATENAGPDDGLDSCVDLGAFMRVYDSLLEYSDILRPLNTMRVDLQAGPTFAAQTGGKTYLWRRALVDDSGPTFNE